MKKILIILLTILLCSCTTVKTEYVYQTVYPELPQLESPLILANIPCTFIMPENPDEKIFIGFDKENYKCYLKNQEINREQKLLFEKFVSEINKERKNWNFKNKKIDNKK